ncbi:MAG: 2-phosphosulfolactate phosphatase, partial [Gemmatimonadetes bacterium]|nr:2-phosphosulfolactate phosphatase [Gemmatimonadota bacterium]
PDARRAAREIGPNALLAGERHSLKIPGFDLGNSPLEFTPERVAGRTIVMTTSNGTLALLAARKAARDVTVGSYVNFSVVLASVRSALRRGLDVAILCAGNGGSFSLEDTACAGRFVRYALRGLPNRRSTVLNDAARAALLIEKPYAKSLARLFHDADHGRHLRDAGFARDLAACRAFDSCPVLPRLVGGALRA